MARRALPTVDAYVIGPIGNPCVISGAELRIRRLENEIASLDKELTALLPGHVSFQVDAAPIHYETVTVQY